MNSSREYIIHGNGPLFRCKLLVSERVRPGKSGEKNGVVFPCNFGVLDVILLRGFSWIC